MVRLIDDKEVLVGLRILAEMAFPKRCHACSREYASVAEFTAATQALHAHCSGLERSRDDDDKLIVALFRKCACGSTLRTIFHGHHDSWAEMSRRQRFGEMLERLVVMGIPRDIAHAELLKFVQGRPNDLLLLRSVRILLVDDSDLVRSILRGILRRHDYQVVGEAHNGVEAVEMARCLKPDVIFMDIEMPIMNGLDALHQIKTLPLNTRVVMVSTQTRKESVAHAISHGAAGFIVKPFNTDRVLETLKHLVVSRMEN